MQGIGINELRLVLWGLKSLDKSWLRSFILSVVQPLKVGKTVSQAQDVGTLDNLFPDGGQSDQFKITSPFGFISGIPKGVAGYYQGLFGTSYENIILGFIHKVRPEPSGPGEAILYSTDPAGASIQIKLTLGSDGTLTISAPVALNIISPKVSIGVAGEKTVNGETFMTDYLTHTHTGNLGAPTGPPLSPQAESAYLSQKVTAEK